MTIFFTSMETPDASTARWTIRKRPEQQGTVMMATVRDFSPFLLMISAIFST
jgi:hypothetical protein